MLCANGFSASPPFLSLVNVQVLLILTNVATSLLIRAVLGITDISISKPWMVGWLLVVIVIVGKIVRDLPLRV